MLQKTRQFFNRRAIALRDVLIAKYPVTHLMMDAGQEDKWIELHQDVLSGGGFLTIGSMLRKADLGITNSTAAGLPSIDLSSAALPFLLSVASRIASSAGQRIFAFRKGEWSDVTSGRFKGRILAPSESGALELAIVSTDRRLIERISVNLWAQKQGYIECLSPYAPIKRLSTSNGLKAPVPRNSDFSVEPIDAVYTWVNASDPDWLRMLGEHKNIDGMDRDRFEQFDELKYSIRSIKMFAPWVRTIYIFSNCAPPTWFAETDNIKWVDHRDVIPSGYLPVFNSHSIETFLHLIPGLSQRFIYFNDDFFLSGVVRPGDFFTPYGASVCRLEPYGGVPYLDELVSQQKAEEWQSAAVNSARLLEKRFGRFPTKVHRHAPYSLDKAVYEEIVAEYPEEVERTRCARFRTPEDVSFTSFFYHHYALGTGRAMESNEESLILRTTNYKRFLDRRMYQKLRFFCMNDGGGSAAHAGYNSFKTTFPERFYPFKTEAEAQ